MVRREGRLDDVPWETAPGQEADEPLPDAQSIVSPAGTSCSLEELDCSTRRHFLHVASAKDIPQSLVDDALVHSQE